MPRFSNLDPGDRGQHQLQRQRIRAAQQQQQQQQAAAAGGYNQHAAAQLRRNASLDEDRGLSGLGIGGGEFAGTTKYTALFRASQQQKEVPAVGTNAGLVNGSASAAVPVYAASVKAADTGGGGYNPSFGGGTSTTRLHQSHHQHQHQHPSHHAHHHQHHPNGIVANGLLHNSNTKDNNSCRSVTFSTNAALAATSPLYSGRHHQQQLQQPPPPSLSQAQQTNKFFSPFRSLPGEAHSLRMLFWLRRFPQKCLVLIPLIRWPSFPGTKLKPEAEDGREIGRLESETETERMMLFLMLELVDADTDVVGFQRS